MQDISFCLVWCFNLGNFILSHRSLVHFGQLFWFPLGIFLFHGIFKSQTFQQITFRVNKQGEKNPNSSYIEADICSMFLLVRRSLKLGISMINESLFPSQSIPSIFVSWLCKSKYQPSKAIDLNSTILGSWNPMKSKKISLALSITNFQKDFLNVNT